MKIKHIVLKSGQRLASGYGASREEVMNAAREHRWMTERDPQNNVVAYVEIEVADHDKSEANVSPQARVPGDGGGASLTDEQRASLEHNTRLRQGTRRSHGNTHSE